MDSRYTSMRADGSTIKDGIRGTSERGENKYDSMLRHYYRS